MKNPAQVKLAARVGIGVAAVAIIFASCTALTSDSDTPEPTPAPPTAAPASPQPSDGGGFDESTSASSGSGGSLATPGLPTEVSGSGGALGDESENTDLEPALLTPDIVHGEGDWWKDAPTEGWMLTDGYDLSHPNGGRLYLGHSGMSWFKSGYLGSEHSPTGEATYVPEGTELHYVAYTENGTVYETGSTVAYDGEFYMGLDLSMDDAPEFVPSKVTYDFERMILPDGTEVVISDESEDVLPSDWITMEEDAFTLEYEGDDVFKVGLP